MKAKTKLKDKLALVFNELEHIEQIELSNQVKDIIIEMEKQEYPKMEKVYVVGTHHYCFRAGEPSLIVGVKMGKPDEKSEPRLVYEVEYSDGAKDQICASEVGNIYKILTFADIKSGKYDKDWLQKVEN